MLYVLTCIISLLIGAGIVFFIMRLQPTALKKITQNIQDASNEEKAKDIELIITQVENKFRDLSKNALSDNSKDFLVIAKGALADLTKLGEKDLEGKKELIDQTLKDMKQELDKVQNVVSELEKDREQKYGELATHLKTATDVVGKLRETADKIKVALASSRIRGQWGERMAEDILRLVGFVEGINYYKQKTVTGERTRPDFTFLLPQDLKVNMDVKFPLDNYMRHIEAESEADKAQFKTQFLKDVRDRIKEVTDRTYINPEDNTVDYVLVFIPNEQVYAFIHEHDNTILDEALKSKVVLCSPITLYAILSIIRQAVDNFNLERTTAQILTILGAFNKQWESFVDSFDKLGKRIDDSQKEFQALTTTRRNQLERQLHKIEDLRRQEGIPLDDETKQGEPQVSELPEPHI